MPPGALKKYLQFPKPPEEDDTEEQAFQKSHALAALSPSRFTVPDDKKSAASQQPPSAPAVQSMPAQGMPQAAGVPTPPPSSMRSGSMDDEIQTQLNAYKTQMDGRPTRDIGAAPTMPQLPQRPQASPWEAIPQLLAGAGNVLSAGSNHPQDYLTPLMAGQKQKRDEVYGDQMAQVHNRFQSEREQYSDKLMRYSMDLRDHEQRLHDLKGHIDMLTEQKFLQGQKTPQDMQYQQKRDAYRAMFDKEDFTQDTEDQARMLKSTRPEDAQIIDEVVQNKKAEIAGRPRGFIEQAIGQPSGRKFFEPPQGRVNQPAGMSPEWKESATKPSSELRLEQLSNPSKTLETYRRVTGKPNATLEDYTNALKKAQKSSEKD